MDTGLFIGYVLAGSIRYWLLTVAGELGISDRVELSTPINSHKRLVEGATLLENGVDPYSGAIFHETPIVLYTFAYLRHLASPPLAHLALVLADAGAAFFLGLLAGSLSDGLLRNQREKAKTYHEDAKSHLMLRAEDLTASIRAVQLTYLFHPYLVLNCAAGTTTVFTNLLLVLFLWSCSRRHLVPACLFLSLATYQTFYPVMLLFPLVLSFGRPALLPPLLTFLSFVLALHYLSFALCGGWGFLGSTFGFILRAPELTPNIGLFWYFFTEMFEHFRAFFIWTFQLNCFIYVLPLSIRLRDQPFLLSWTLIALTAIFKSYPCYGDVGFYLALLPMLGHLLPYAKQTFISSNAFVAATILGPVLHQMWIYNGSANANYFFAINLVFGVAQILLITDYLFAHLKREFYLANGFKALHANADPTKNPRLALI